MKTHRKTNFPNPFLALPGLKSHTVRGFYGVVIMKKCTKCGEEKDRSGFYRDRTHVDGLQSRCKTCDNIAQRKYYENNRESLNKRSSDYNENNKCRIVICAQKYRSSKKGKSVSLKSANRYAKKFPLQRKAVVAVKCAIKAGKIHRKETCSTCGKKRLTDAHHHDYSKPLEVVFLCRSCHAAWHKNNTPLNRG